MFYITNIAGVRSPYRVEEINKDQQSGQGSKKQFGDESESEHHEKFLKASEKLYKKRSVILARQIMNKTMVRLNENLSLKEAWELIRKHKVEYFPIVSEEGKLVGILSEKDILREMKERSENKPLKDVVCRQTVCTDGETSLQDVMQMFFKENIEAMPVIDEREGVIGIVSRNDLFQTMIKVSNIKP